jgi:hypothetical protein
MMDAGCLHPSRLEHLKPLAAWLGLAAPPRTGTLLAWFLQIALHPPPLDLGACASERRAYSADLFAAAI